MECLLDGRYARFALLTTTPFTFLLAMVRFLPLLVLSTILTDEFSFLIPTVLLHLSRR